MYFLAQISKLLEQVLGQKSGILAQMLTPGTLSAKENRLGEPRLWSRPRSYINVKELFVPPRVQQGGKWLNDCGTHVLTWSTSCAIPGRRSHSFMSQVRAPQEKTEETIGVEQQTEGSHQRGRRQMSRSVWKYGGPSLFEMGWWVCHKFDSLYPTMHGEK